MATIVMTSEEDPSLTVVRFTSELGWADAGPEVAEPQVTRLVYEAQQCIMMGRWLDLASLMLTSADLVFSSVSEKDLECIFTIICNLVTNTESPDEALEMAKLISAKVTQQPTDKPSLRLKILFNLYNLLENPYSRFFVYMKALNLAVNGKVTENIIPSFRKIDSFLKEWNIGVLEQRDLYLTIYNILKEHKSSSKDVFNFLTKYLETFSSEDAYAMSEAKEEAVQAIIEFVKAPDMFQCDLLDMPAIGQLEKDGKNALVYQLLKIFLAQRLDAYLDFHAANSTLLKGYVISLATNIQALNDSDSQSLLVQCLQRLVHEDCITKMRLMSLADLSSNCSGEIPYSLIKHALRVNDEEVEFWVVKAITTKLVDCKMDQMNEIVIVSRCTERVFGLSQWRSLRSQLGVWRANISNVISTIQANRTTEETSQASQGLMIR